MKFQEELDATVNPFEPGCFEEYGAIDASTRVFTPRRLARGQRDIMFTLDEDPDGMLKRLKTDHYVHSDDNCVEYRLAEINNGHITG